MSGAEQVNGSFGSFGHLKNFGSPIVAVSTYTHVLQKRSTEGWPTNCCCEHKHVCYRLIQRRSQVKVWRIQQLWQTNCCCEHTHRCVAEEVKWRLHPSANGWPTNCCGHAHVCFWIHTCLVQNKSIEALIMLKTLADRLLLWAHTHICCWRGQLRVDRPIAAVNTNVCLAE